MGELSRDVAERYRFWLESPVFDENTKTELRTLAGNNQEIEDRFYRELEFGTGGLRHTARDFAAGPQWLRHRPAYKSPHSCIARAAHGAQRCGQNVRASKPPSLSLEPSSGQLLPFPAGRSDQHKGRPPHAETDMCGHPAYPGARKRHALRYQRLE